MPHHSARHTKSWLRESRLQLLDEIEEEACSRLFFQNFLDLLPGEHFHFTRINFIKSFLNFYLPFFLSDWISILIQALHEYGGNLGPLLILELESNLQ